MDRFADLVLTPIALFSGRPLAVGIAFGIIGSALLLWLLALRPAERRFLSPLWRTARALRALSAKAETPEALFAEADAVFAANSLAPAWRRYHSGVEFEDGAAFSYSDPADFFALVHLPGHSYPKWSSTLAGVFLTVGLFFTFVGLSAALLQLGGHGHDSLSPAQLKQAVEGILAVSSVKFITSIAGILAYIFWSVIARQQAGAQTQAEDALLHEIRALSTYVAPEMILRRQLRLMEAQNARFGGLFEALDVLPRRIGDVQSGLGNEIGRGAEELNQSAARMAALMEQSQDRMAATLAAFELKIANLPSAFAATAEQGARDMSAALRQTLDGAALAADEAGRAGAEKMTARIEGVAAALAAAAAALTQAGVESRAQMAEGAKAVSASGEEAAARLTRMVDAFASAVGRLSERLGQTEQALAAHNEELDRSGAAVASASGELVHAAGAMEGAAAPLTEATHTFREAMVGLGEAARRIETIAASGDQIAGHVAAYGAQMTHSLASFESLSETFKATQTGFGDEIGRGAGELSQSAARMAAQMEQAQERLAATLGAFEARIAGIAPAIAAAAEDSTRKAGSALLASLDSAAQVTEQASRTNSEEISARVESVAAALTAAASALAQAGVDSRAQMSEGMQAVTATGEEAAARLARMVDSFATAVASLSTRLDQTEQALAAHNERLDKSGEIVSGASNNLALAAGAMESAAAPLTTATLTFRDAMTRLTEAAARIEQISSSGDAIAGHIAAFGAQMTGALTAFDALPDKIKATEGGFGDEIGRSAAALGEAAKRMSAGFEQGQASLAATLASFEARILAMPAALASASEQSSREIGEKVQTALDSVAAVATRATSGGADLFAARVDEIARSLAMAADRLMQASDASGVKMRESQDMLAAGAAQGAQLISGAAEGSAEMLNRTVERFADSARGLSLKLAEVALGMDAQNARLEKAGAIVSGASEALAEAAGTVKDAAPPLASASASLKGAMDNFAGAAEQVRAVSESGRQVVETFRLSAAQANDSLGAHAASFREVERAVAKTLDELTGGVQALGHEISTCIETYDNEIARSIGSLEAALIDMGDIIDNRAGKKTAEAR
ncbi:hypothetical protein K9U33_08670 [Rhodoblastus acidophilus]|uniref:Methyl-accepting chemotaxis protein n=1 Tax=Candidatus Rhodoblastus alkanivorans TaxID=2954117 RepID=A0ABS9ZA30_9HYPH|nr:hypothetical protein [Candidatus Rhodoblastus alkanivorans]MCI4678722.1 hypothetical protein [Candidatus Rhodoblastus alkanivorans]MCI4683482.1 hypothetical protein [Candidatus Rhodoblastus alkanivorans]